MMDLFRESLSLNNNLTQLFCRGSLNLPASPPLSPLIFVCNGIKSMDPHPFIDEFKFQVYFIIYRDTHLYGAT